MEMDVTGRRKQTRGIRQFTPITINSEYLKLNIKNKEQHMFLVSVKESYHVSTMASYYIVGGVVVTHTLYNLHSVSLRKSMACVRILTLGQHCLCLVIQS